MSPRLRKLLVVVPVVAALMAAAVWLRHAGCASVVFRPDRTQFWEFDPYYHVWRVFQTLRDFPHVPVFDAAMNTPHGATVIWPPLFDGCIALVAGLAGLGAGDVAAVEHLAAWFPPLLAALTVPFLFLSGRRILGSSTWALLGCALFIANPIHMWYSRLGFVDHHVAVTLVQVLMLAAFLRLLERGGRRVADLALGSLAIAAGFLVWNGFLFFVFVLDVFLLVAMVANRREEGSGVWVAGLVTHLAAAAIIAPFVVPVVAASGMPFSPLMLSWLPVGALLLFAGVAALEGLRRALAGRSPRLRRALLAAPVAAAALLLAPHAGGLRQGFEWLLASDRFMGSVVESGSPFVTGGVFTLRPPWAWFTGFFFLAPLSLGILAWELRRGGRDNGRLMLLVCGILLLVMSSMQRRFAEPFSPVLALLAAVLLRQIYTWVVALGNWLKAPDGRAAVAGVAAPSRIPAATGGALGALIIVLCWAFSPSQYLTSLAAETRYSSELGADIARFGGMLDAREGPVPAGVPRADGTLSLWDLGHRILYAARTPVVANNFGLHIGEDSWNDSAGFFMKTDEGEAVALLEARRVRYVVADFSLSTAQNLAGYTGADPGGYFRTEIDARGNASTLMLPALTRTLFFRLGSSTMGSQGSMKYPDGTLIDIAPLGHFRLLMESPANEARMRPLRMFERVAGARVRIEHVPGGPVEIRYAWRDPAGRERRWRRQAEVRGGVAEVIVPYSSERPDLGQDSACQVTAAGGRSLSLRIAEADVMEGRTVQAAFQW